MNITYHKNAIQYPSVSHLCKPPVMMKYGIIHLDGMDYVKRDAFVEKVGQWFLDKYAMGSHYSLRTKKIGYVPCSHLSKLPNPGTTINFEWFMTFTDLHNGDEIYSKVIIGPTKLATEIFEKTLAT